MSALKPDPQGPRHRGQPEAEADQGHPKAEGNLGEPKFFADVEYRYITSDGLLRASSFKGLTCK